MGEVKYNYNIMIGSRFGKTLSLILDAITYSYECDVVMVGLDIKNIRNSLIDYNKKLNDINDFDFDESVHHITNKRSKKQIRLIKYKHNNFDGFRGYAITCLLIDDFDSLFIDEDEKKDFLNCILPCILASRGIIKIASNKPIIL